MPRLAGSIGLLTVALVGWLGAGHVTGEPKRWVPAPGKSEVAFTARFRLGDFSGRADRVSGEFKLDPTDLRQPVTGLLRVEAASLRTGIEGRDRDLRKVLETDRFPEIRFTVDGIEPSFPSVTDKTDVLLTIRGQMVIRDVQRPMTFLARVRARDGGDLWARGDASLKMTDFGITPPRRLFLAVGDQVVVTFDLALISAD